MERLSIDLYFFTPIGSLVNSFSSRPRNLRFLNFVNRLGNSASAFLERLRRSRFLSRGVLNFDGCIWLLLKLISSRWVSVLRYFGKLVILLSARFSIRRFEYFLTESGTSMRFIPLRSKIVISDSDLALASSSWLDDCPTCAFETNTTINEQSIRMSFIDVELSLTCK